MTACPFCSMPEARVILQNETAVAVRDTFPVSAGHILVVPRRHVVSIFDLENVEHEALWLLVREARDKLYNESAPHGFNIGINDGAVAGQTIMHAHVHVIPRWRGDVEDPRGGIRHVIPGKAEYWKQ